MRRPTKKQVEHIMSWLWDRDYLQMNQLTGQTPIDLGKSYLKSQFPKKFKHK